MRWRMITTTCHCGAVRVTQSARPAFVHACNCSLCRASGAQWAYPAPAGVTVTGSTATYRRADKPDAGADIHFCPRCGTTTHFTLTPETVARFGDGMMGVNVALARPGDLAGVERRFPDGRNWSGEGAFGYRRAAQVIGEAEA